MSQMIISALEGLPKTMQDMGQSLLSDSIINKASEYVRRYETETDALLFREGLMAIKDMLRYVKRLPLSIRGSEFSRILDELCLRIKEVDGIIMKLRGKRPAPPLSSDDRKAVSEIEASLKSICRGRYDISFKNIAPLLLEVSKRPGGEGR